MSDSSRTPVALDVDSPSYSSLFRDTLNTACTPDALESKDGPLKYLFDLHEHAKKLEENAQKTIAVTLDERRPDIAQLLLDEQSVNQVVPTLDLVIDTLARQAQQRVPDKQTLSQAIAQAYFPAQLPFHYPHEQILAVLRQKKTSLFNLLQQAGYYYPNFCYGSLRNAELRQVMLSGSTLSPTLQSLLLDQNAGTKSDFFLKYFGLSATPNEAVIELSKADNFARLTQLSLHEVQALLAISFVDSGAEPATTAVKQSARFKPTQPAASGYLYGAAYVNDGTAPAMSLLSVPNLPNDPNDKGSTPTITNTTPAHFERMQKLASLRYDLQLPFADVDLLVVSALRAEGQTKNYRITANTLRALGVFRYFNFQYDTNAEQFAALLCDVSPYAVGEATPFLDQLLDRTGESDTVSALVLDGAQFNPDDEKRDSSGQSGKSTFSQMCQALAIDERIGRRLLTYVLKEQKLDKPVRSLSLFSALYRLARLPYALGLSAVEGLCLIELLAQQNPQLMPQIAGLPSIKDDQPDILDVLIAVANTAQWLKQNKLSAQALLAWLAPLPESYKAEFATPTSWSAAISGAGASLEAALITEDELGQAAGRNVTLKNPAEKWSQVLNTVLDNHGLVKVVTPESGKSWDEYLQTQVSGCLNGKVESNPLHQVDLANLTDSITALINDARIAQEDVAKSIIKNAFSGDRPAQLDDQHALLLLRWLDISIDSFNAEALMSWKKIAEQEPSAKVFSKTSLSWWYDLHRHANVIKHLRVSPGCLQMLLDHPEWMDVGYADYECPTANLDLCYQLSCYNRWISSVSSTGNEEEDALTYLRQVNDPNEAWSEQQSADRLAKLIGWTNEDVLCAVQAVYSSPTQATAAAQSTATNPPRASIAYIISDIDYVMRLKSASHQIGLSCSSLLELAKLRPDSSFDAFQSAGALLLAGCSEDEHKQAGAPLKEAWRDALVAYLMGHWLPSAPKNLSSLITDTDELSHYFLTDVQVSAQVKTSKVAYATASLQHYLHRIFTHLETGYNQTDLPQKAHDEWRRYRSQYPLWRSWQQQINHPENLIYPSQRVGKSQAFIELENELNQGKLTNGMVQTAVTNYLSKFEHVSNLQVVSGYLDGFNPREDTYHFIGRTNIDPPEYYWRSLDMSLRDDKERLSPLAWSEWETIRLPVSGQIVETPFSDKQGAQIKVDAIRPIMIAGRQYVIWIERDRSPLPSADATNQTPTKFRRISVFYAFKQSDGLWSPANELMCLDGTENGKRLPDDDNPYLKDDTYVPGLVAVVDVEGDREADPWLVVMIYDASKDTLGEMNQDYFLEVRDLLLIERKQLDSSTGSDAIKQGMPLSLYRSYRDVRCLQHTYIGATLDIALKKDNTAIPMLHVPAKNVSATEPWNVEWPLITLLKELMKPLENHATTRDQTARLRTSIIEAYFGLAGPIIRDGKAENDAIWAARKAFSERVKGFKTHVFAPPEIYALLLENLAKGKLIDRRLRVYSYTHDTEFEKGNSIPGMSHIHFFNDTEPCLVKIQKTDASSDQLAVIGTYRKAVIKEITSKIFKTIKGEWSEIRPGENKKITCTFNSKRTADTVVSLIFSIAPTLKYNKDNATKPHLLIGTTRLDMDRENSTSDALIFTCLVPAIDLLRGNPKIAFELRGYFDNVDEITLPLTVETHPEAFEKITLKLFGMAPGETTYTELKEQTVIANGNAHVEYPSYPYSGAGKYTFVLAEAGNPDVFGGSTYDISDTGADVIWFTRIQRNQRQAQYLDLSDIPLAKPPLPFKFVRLNTLFGKQLVACATQSVDRVLRWDTQQLLEPAIEPGSPDSPVDFHGANGRYFRELFLHLPALVATRLSEEQQFQDAERWCTDYLFAPYRTQPGEQALPPFWNTRPLAEVGTGTSVMKDFIEPLARAFSSSRYYRRAVVLFLIEHWQREGDFFYRQLTRDSLNEAWLRYQQALKLIGPMPERSAVTDWAPTPLKDVYPLQFRAPVNQRLGNLRTTLENRLYNLRHGLTLDGKVMPFIPLYAEGENPFPYASGRPGSLTTTFNSNLLQVPPYRFNQMLHWALEAAKQLTDMGRHLMTCMESEFNTSLSVMLQAQQVQLSQFTLKLQEQAVEAAMLGKSSIRMSKQSAAHRKSFYTDLHKEGRSTFEKAAITYSGLSSALEFASSPFSVAAGLLDTVPNIFGMAIGGQKYAGAVQSGIASMHAASLGGKYIAERLTLEAEYERRSQGWELEIRLAELELQLIDQQLVEQDLLIKRAQVSLDEIRAQRACQEEAYVAMTTGFTIIPTYNWLVARLTTLYAPAYDAVLSLCLATEAAWRYEIGDYRRGSFIRTSAWNDSFRGMLAGESLQLDLQEMHTAYAQNNERRMNIKKTFSLRERRGIKDDAGWLDLVKSLTTTALNVELKASDYDRNYPGHYLRQLKHISVSFKMTANGDDTLQEICAVLTQTSSSTLVNPDIEGAKYLYAKDGSKPTASVKSNFRARQQIALSSTVADDGRGVGKEDWLCELMFDDGRYLPFEGTGAISNWTLEFPDQDTVERFLSYDPANKDKQGNPVATPRVTDIQLHVVYTALDGGSQFASEVKTLRN
jgi:hypothetical protein